LVSGLLRAEEAVQLEPLKTSITVTAKIDAEVPGVVSKLDTTAIESRPGLNLDDRLRDVPGFSLFRRSPSLATHPTAQGISLRGIGSSGASRTLVLLDGLPANDPFGGWVYWSRFNPDTLDRVEVTRAASSSVFGDRAMGGAISLFTPSPEQRQFSGSFEAGNAGVYDARGGYADLWGPVGASVFLRGFSTDGYYIVPASIRGAADRRAGVDFVTGDVKLDWFGAVDRVSVKGNVLTERRENGTALTQNSSSLGTLGVHYSRESVSLMAYHSRGEFHSSFSTVLAGRNSERPTFNQRVPSEDTGVSGVWAARRSSAWNLTLGADVHRPSGESIDTLFPMGRRVGGGHLWQQGTFLQTDAAVGRRVRLHGGLRHDFTGQGKTFWSPSFGLVVSDGPRRWRATAFRSFRAPTLNELFRVFSLGNTLTLANPDLRPETLVGGEVGMDWQARTWLVRASGFWNAIDDLVGNVTLSTTPALITRQRRNLIAATTRGGELEVQKAFRRVRAQAAYLFVDARLDSRLRIPQVGRHQGSAQVLYEAGRTLASIGLRSYAMQFEDDLNRFVLPGFATVQVLVRQRLAYGFSAVAAVENLLDRTYLVGIVPTIGAPRLWRAGVKWESGR
jgi:outer membrane receptor protein involved in Fe transport